MVDNKLFIALGLFGVLAWLTLTKEGENAAGNIGAGVATMIDKAMHIGERNNNPGNLYASNIAWNGLADPPDDGTFAIFTDPVYGIRAMAKTLSAYQFKHGISTIADMIARYSPGNGAGNTPASTTNYAAFVAAAVGVAPTDPVDITGNLQTIVPAMITFEQGRNIYPSALINGAISAALG